ncbi:MAG: serine/threonine-protein kinase, partial [Myxococcota bacterium]
MTTAVVFKRGDRVGRYVVLEKVGAGGMGVVYGAFDPKLGRRVALKLLHSHESESRVSVGHDRLLREAQATARLSHRNTVAIHDVGEHGGRVFLAMEYVSGRTLRELIEQDTPPWRDVLRLYCDAGEGLAAAHDKELVHRDFKPDNVTVDTAGRVRVMDFGLAVAAADSTSRGGSSSRLDEPEPETPDGRAQVVGTPAYMAPEQFEGSVVGPAADQFSFCVSLYEGLYSERPFAGASTHEIARSVTLGELRPAPRSDVPRWVRQAVLRGLATNPTERHASMRALLDALAPPSRRFRRGAITVGVLGAGVVATAVVGLHARDARRLARCETVAAEAHAAWDAEAQARVESAIRNASLSFGDRATADARRGLDEYVERWAEARRQVCTTATIDHTLEDALARRAVACLDDRRAEFEQLVEQ